MVEEQQARQVFVGQHRLIDGDPAAVFRRLGQDVLEAAYIGAQIHDNALANGINRRVGHLCEKLLEIVRQLRRTVRQHGQRIIRAHGPERLLTAGGHRPDDFGDVLIGKSERLLAAEEGLFAGLLQFIVIGGR